MAGSRQFRRHSVGLVCRQLKGAHTFNVLACAMNDIHSEYEICEKIVRTTTDNGSNFIKAFRVFGKDETKLNIFGFSDKTRQNKTP